jgi:hypothetical protein
MKWMERKYVCRNGVVERTRYAVGDNAKARRGRKKGNTSIRKQEANFHTAVRRLARTLNCNYSHENGLLLTLDYDEKGLEKLMKTLPERQQELLRQRMLPVGQVGTWKSVKIGKPCATVAKVDSGAEENEELAQAMDALREAAEHQLFLWIRRVKRKYGKELKFVAVTADLDGDTGELVRIHHHLPIAAEGISWDLLRKEWKLGSVDIVQLRHNVDYTPIAVYLMRQVRRRPDAKKYRVSRGMEQPEVMEREIFGHVQMRVPVGALLLESSEFQIDNPGQYMRYIPRKKSPKTDGGGDGHGL